MKQTVKLLIVALLTIATSAVAFAKPQSKQQRMSRENLAQVQARHIAGQLALDESTTDRFVAVYCQQQKEVWALGPRVDRKSKASDEELIQQRFDRSEKILAIRKKYYKEYSKFLTQAQIKRAYELERQMMKRLQQKGKRQHQQKGK